MKGLKDVINTEGRKSRSSLTLSVDWNFSLAFNKNGNRRKLAGLVITLRIVVTWANDWAIKHGQWPIG